MATLNSILSELKKKGTPQMQKNYARHRMARRIGEKRQSTRC